MQACRCWDVYAYQTKHNLIHKQTCSSAGDHRGHAVTQCKCVCAGQDGHGQADLDVITAESALLCCSCFKEHPHNFQQAAAHFPELMQGQGAGLGLLQGVRQGALPVVCPDA